MDKPQAMIGVGSIEEFKKSIQEKNCIWFIGTIDPKMPGVKLFTTKLRRKYFPPASRYGRQFFAAMVGWSGVTWIVIGVPNDKKALELAGEAAKDCGVITPKGTPSVVLEDGSEKRFPMDGDKVFQIIYENGFYPGLDFPKDAAQIYEKEDQVVAEATKKFPLFDMAYT